MKKLQDLAIRAMDGSIFTDGELHIVSDCGVSLKSSAAGQKINVVFDRSRALVRTSFRLFQEVKQGGDGFYSASAPDINIEFPPTADPLELFIAEQKIGKKRVNCYDTPIASVYFRDPSSTDDDPRILWASGSCIEYEFEPSEVGWRINFEMMVSLSQSSEQEPLFKKAKVFGSVQLPAAYCALRGLQWPYSIHSAPVDETETSILSLENAAISVHGSPYCPGQIDWNDESDLQRPTGPFVSLGLRDREMTFDPVGPLRRLDNGFSEEVRYTGGGPRLTIPSGFADWIRMLEDEDDVEVYHSGDGIGYLDGMTGREAYECGGLRQPITQIRLGLSRKSDGLLVTGNGELGPLKRPVDWAKPLGPSLKFEFLIPRAWILSQGIRLPRFWEDWKADFPSEGTW